MTERLNWNEHGQWETLPLASPSVACSIIYHVYDIYHVYHVYTPSWMWDLWSFWEFVFHMLTCVKVPKKYVYHFMEARFDDVDVLYTFHWLPSWVSVVKNLHASAKDIRDAGSTHGLGRCPGWGHNNPFQYSFLENPMDRRAWWPTVYRVAKCWTWLKQLQLHSWS